MTLFIKLKNGQPLGHPVTESNFRKLFPSTSFPKFFTADAVKPLGYGLYDFSNQPELGRYQKAVEVSPARSEAGIWRQAWQIVEMDVAEKAGADKQQADDIRSKRDKMIADTDWMALSDNTLTPAWATYRQALRDITDHVNFPYLADADWPVKPA